MRNAGGYAEIISPQSGTVDFDGLGAKRLDAGVTKTDSFTCFHCNTVIHVLPKQDPANIGGLCKHCMKLICPHCVDVGSCTPFEKKLEQMEERDRVRRSYGF